MAKKSRRSVHRPVEPVAPAPPPPPPAPVEESWPDKLRKMSILELLGFLNQTLLYKVHYGRENGIHHQVLQECRVRGLL